MYNASDRYIFETAEALESKINTLSGRDVVPIGILNTDFTYLNYTPENPSLNSLTEQNGVLYPISGKPAFSYKHISVIAALKKLALIAGNQVTYRFSNSVWYQYGTKNITALTADFGTGTTIPIIQNGQLIQTDFHVNYTTLEETKLLTFNITYSDTSTLTTYAGIDVGQKPVSSTAKGISQLLPFESTIPDVTTGAKGKIEYRIFYGDNNVSNTLNKPFIIVDGFDPGDKRKIVELDCENDILYKCVEKNKDWGTKPYESIEFLMQYNNQTSDLKEQLTALNYDVIIVNFPNYVNNLGNTIDGGADDIFRNGRTMASFITHINGILQTNGSTEKLVIVGPSMGGQITRYALAYLEKNNIPTNTSFWISMDSPHQGATIPLAVSGDLYFMGELLGKDEAKEQYRNTIKSPAARQMLLGIAGGQTNFYNTEHDAYIQELKANGVAGSNGYPVLNGIKKIAIANGSMIGIKNVNPSEKFYEIAAFAKVKFFGIKVDNKPVFRLNNWFMPEKNTTSTLLRNYSYQPEQTLNWSLVNNLWMGSLDAVPGGNFNSADDMKHAVHDQLNEINAFSFPLSGSWFIVPFLWTGEKLIIEQRLPDNINTAITPQAFIPTHSALDTSGFTDWYQPISKNISCTGQTKFDSFYGENYNMGHISFTNGMVDWLMKNLTVGLQAPHFPIPDSSLQGSSSICENTNTTYTFGDICKLPSNATWSVSGNLEIVSQTGLGVTVKGTYNGVGVISAVFQNGQIFQKEIWVGAPIFKNFNFINNTGVSYCLAPTDQLKIDLPTDKVVANFAGMTSLDIFNNNNWEWQRSNNLIIINSSTDKNTRTICPMGPGFSSFKVRAKNACGWSEWYEIPEFEITALPPGIFMKQSANNFTVFPNPSNDVVYIGLKDITKKPEKETVITGELYDILGFSKTKVSIANNKASFSVKGLNKGIYILKIYINNQVESHQISVE